MTVELLDSLAGEEAFELGTVFDSLAAEGEPVVVRVASNAGLSPLAWAVVERAIRRFAGDGLEFDLRIEGDSWPPARRQASAMLDVLQEHGSLDEGGDGSDGTK